MHPPGASTGSGSSLSEADIRQLQDVVADLAVLAKAECQVGQMGGATLPRCDLLLLGICSQCNRTINAPSGTILAAMSLQGMLQRLGGRFSAPAIVRCLVDIWTTWLQVYSAGGFSRTARWWGGTQCSLSVQVGRGEGGLAEGEQRHQRQQAAPLSQMDAALYCETHTAVTVQ
jgi:hypothetical protein